MDIEDNLYGRILICKSSSADCSSVPQAAGHHDPQVFAASSRVQVQVNIITDQKNKTRRF